MTKREQLQRKLGNALRALGPVRGVHVEAVGHVLHAKTPTGVVLIDRVKAADRALHQHDAAAIQRAIGLQP